METESSLPYLENDFKEVKKREPKEEVYNNKRFIPAVELQKNNYSKDWSVK